MSAVRTSYTLTQSASTEYADLKKPVAPSNVIKYLDLDSTFRNRNNYPNPNNFVVPIYYPNRTSESFTALDPIVNAFPFSGSWTEYPGALLIGVGSTTTSVVLDSNEIDVDNYYINCYLQVGAETRRITYYDGSTTTATVSPAFSVPPVNGTVYYTRKTLPIFVGTISAIPNTFTIVLDPSASDTDKIYNNSFIRITSGAETDFVSRIVNYVGVTRTITLASSLPSTSSVGESIELGIYTRDNASTLIRTSGISQTSTSGSYYEIELLYLTVPNRILKVGYGGKLDNYPYIYLRLYNEGNPQATQVLYSNNPNSPAVLFKIPVDQYFGSTAFMTLVNCKTRHVININPDQDLRMTLTLPDGSIIQYADDDTKSPYEPDPFIQVSAYFAMRKLLR